MEKVYGATERQDGLYNIGRNKWELIYGFGKDSDDAEFGYNWRARFIGIKPTSTECVKLIKETINKASQEKILSGFSWKGMPVWLSTENQFDYTIAHDLSLQTNGESLPVRFKFGTDETPQYYTFESVEELDDFYRSAIKYIQKVLADGWDEKDWVQANKTIFE